MAASPSTRPLRVYVVDDDPNELIVYEHYLDGQGWEVEVHHCIESLLRSLHERKNGFAEKELILLDYGMTVNGLESLRMIKQAGIDIPVLVNSNVDLVMDYPEKAVELFDAGAFGIFRKERTSDLKADLVHFVNGAINGAMFGRAAIDKWRQRKAG